MKAVILSGGPGTTPPEQGGCYPDIMFPLANEPLIKHLLSILRRNGIIDVAIVSPHSLDERAIKGFGNEHGVGVSFFVEKHPRGTAGALKSIEGFIGASPFFVISGNVFLGSLNLFEVLSFHLTRMAGITVVVRQDDERWDDLENITVDKDGVIERFHILHHSKDKRQVLRSCGLYVFSPDVLDFIHEDGYMDIKEQLIPSLLGKGVAVRACDRTGYTRMLTTLDDFFHLNREMLLGGMNNKEAGRNSNTEIEDRVWVGSNVSIASTANLVGPLVIGDGCTIKDHSQVIGPTSIGSGSVIEENAMVRDSILWENARLKSNSRTEYSLVGRGCSVGEGERLSEAVVMRNQRYGGSVNFSSIDNGGVGMFANGDALSTTMSYMRKKVFLASKMVLDTILSSAGLIILLPLFVIIAIAIKLNSSGPVFFSQKRCGKGGKEFGMLKFRSMVRDAEKIQKELIESKDVDGPVFKMLSDPRITRVGAFLRKTSMDELPQLFNVLKGDMSLVGPRPLVMDEMRFAPRWRDIRLKVKPGLTGLWQISGRGDISFHAWIKHDIAYVRDQSIWLDIRILMKTVVCVVRGMGAH